MAMSPSVAASRAARNRRLNIQSAIAYVFACAVILVISYAEWVLLEPFPWYGRLAVIVFCWLGGAATVFFMIYNYFNRENPQKKK